MDTNKVYDRSLEHKTLRSLEHLLNTLPKDILKI